MKKRKVILCNLYNLFKPQRRYLCGCICAYFYVHLSVQTYIYKNIYLHIFIYVFRIPFTLNLAFKSEVLGCFYFFFFLFLIYWKQSQGSLACSKFWYCVLRMPLQYGREIDKNSVEVSWINQHLKRKMQLSFHTSLEIDFFTRLARSCLCVGAGKKNSIHLCETGVLGFNLRK